MQRKKEHIKLAGESQTAKQEIDDRFYYEPMLSAHPNENTITPINFAGKTMNYPIWISSITGGTEIANKINHNLARVAGEFGLGMALGSCRSLLNDKKYREDFELRDIIGNEHPFYTNFGIAQLEELLREKRSHEIENLVDFLKADGVFIHVNPLQEVFQKEGDILKVPAIETIEEFTSKTSLKVFVKEVGQGFGKESLKELLKLPIHGIELSGFGGTNFSQLELLRSKTKNPLTYVGHDVSEMVDILNDLKIDKTKEIIISGGVKSFLDGYYYINKINYRAVYGQAYELLLRANESYDVLRDYVSNEIEGLKIAQSFLKIKK